MIRTHVDAGVQIAAVRGDPDLARSVYELLDNPECEFVANVFVRLEVLPKATHQRRAAEVAFCLGFFARVAAWANSSDAVVDLAERGAAWHGLSALDALHVAAALMLGAEELVTTEGPRKPIHLATGVRVVAI